MALAGTGYGCLGSCIGACAGGLIGGCTAGTEGAVKWGFSCWLIGYFAVNGVLQFYDAHLAVKSDESGQQEGTDENGRGEGDGPDAPPQPPPPPADIVDIPDLPGKQ